MLTETTSDAEIRILHVEDDDDDAFVIRRTLKNLTANIFLDRVDNGQEAKSLISKDTTALPDLILLDLNMPVMNGQEFLSWLRQDERFKELSVIVLTTSRDEHVLAEARDIGANAALSKEMDPDDVDRLAQMIIDYWFAGTIVDLKSELIHSA